MPRVPGQGILSTDMSEEPEDLNEFNSWDILGAMLMLTIVPAVFNFVFNNQDITGSCVIAAIAVVVSLLVFGLSVLTRWKIIGKIVNLLGNVLTVGYIVLAIYLWTSGGTAPVPEETPVSETPAAE